MGRKPYILVLRQLGGIGDFLALSPVSRGLQETYPDHDIKLVTASVYLGGALTDIASHNPLWDEVILVEPNEMTDQQTKDVWGRYYGSSPNIENELFWKMADKTIGLNCACVQYEWPAQETPEGIQKPRYQVWCEAAGVVPSSYAPIYVIKKDERKYAEHYTKEHWAGKKVVGVGLSACDKKRAWSVGKLTELCQKLLDAGLHPVTIDPTCTIPGFEGLIGKRIRELIPLIEQMDVCVSVDSGLIHMAGVVGTPIVGIFGPTDYKMRMGPYLGSATDSRQLVECAPCWYKYQCLGKDHPCRPYTCLNKIAVDVVVEEILRWTHGRQSKFMV
jgi:ADP-heptose:LPS heptosyltransferase